MAEETQKQLAKLYAPAVLKRLSDFPSKDQRSIAAWLLQIPVGTNYALQILELLLDLARKEEAPASRVLTQILKDNFSQEAVKNILPKDQGRRVRDFLHRRLHPKSSEHWEKFQAFVKELNLPMAVRLVPPKNFEGKQYHLDLCFEDLSTLKEQLKALQTSLVEKNWKILKEF